jgi:hypothetical protein
MYIERKFEESATYMYSRLIFGNLSKDFKSLGPSFKYMSTSSASALFLFCLYASRKRGLFEVEGVGCFLGKKNE